jgi:hypothetical protein
MGSRRKKTTQINQNKRKFFFSSFFFRKEMRNVTQRDYGTDKMKREEWSK